MAGDAAEDNKWAYDDDDDDGDDGVCCQSRFVFCATLWHAPSHAYTSTEKSYHSAHISHPRMPTVACDVQLARNTDRVAVIDQWRNFNQSSWEVCEL